MAFNEVPNTTSFSTKKVFTFLMVTLSLLGVIDAAFCWDYYPTSHQWGFQNYGYLGFNKAVNFTDSPRQGVPFDNSSIGYWNMDEGSGAVAHDSSGNGNNGTISGATWVTGKYGNALNFNGTTDYITTATLTPAITKNNSFTMSGWYNPSSTGSWKGLFSLSGNYIDYSLYATHGARPFFYHRDSVGDFGLYGVDVTIGQWVHLAVTYDVSTKTYTLYQNGVQRSNVTRTSLASSDSSTLRFAQIYPEVWFSGIIDEVRVYNRALRQGEIAASYTMGPYAQPDPVSFVNYYNYKDPITNNTMLIHVNSPNANGINVALVTCTSFFEGNRLTFQSNNSATANVWTNLGEPAFIMNGAWNSENYTTTLTLDASSIAEIQWRSGTSPSASSLSASSTTAGKTVVFSALWSDNQSLSGGGYIFSTNNTGQWVNASWTPFPSTPFWGNVSLSLTSNVGGTIGFWEFANNSLNLWGDSGIYAITTTNDTSMATPTPMPSSAPTASPTPTTSTTTPTSTSTPISKPTATPTLQPEANQFPIQTIAIVADAVAVLVVAFAVAFKKGYITIEVVDEENPEETSDDYSI